MSEALTPAYYGATAPANINRLPISMRMPAAERKYADAVAMYAATDLSIRSVAAK